MISRKLIAALTKARRLMPQQGWVQLSDKLASTTGCPDSASVAEATRGILNRDAAWVLSEAISATSATWAEIAASVATVDYLMGNVLRSTEIIWTGPPNKRFPVRRIDQVLYDLISKAKRRIVLVTFAASRVDHLCSHLTAAVNRGVELTLIFESEAESEGQLSIDATAAFKNVPLDQASIFYWPVEKRGRNGAGRPGKLHVKCAIVDDVSLIGSANLTDDAFNRNMELGMLIIDAETSAAIAEHFLELVTSGVLAKIK